jgi:hypothetical protein
VEQELLILPEHLCSPPVFSWARVTRSIVYCVLICRSLFVLLRFLFAHCVDWPSLIYGFTTFVVFKLFVNVVGYAQKLDISLTMMHIQMLIYPEVVFHDSYTVLVYKIIMLFMLQYIYHLINRR